MKLLRRLFVIFGLVFAGQANCAVVTSTLNNVNILGTTYNVTFHQDDDGQTSFNDVFGTTPAIVHTFNLSTVDGASLTILQAIILDGNIDLLPALSPIEEPASRAFFLPFESNATEFLYNIGIVIGGGGVFETNIFTPLNRTQDVAVSFVTLEAISANNVPEPNTWILLSLALLSLSGVLHLKKQR